MEMAQPANSTMAQDKWDKHPSVSSKSSGTKSRNQGKSNYSSATSQGNERYSYKNKADRIAKNSDQDKVLGSSKKKGPKVRKGENMSRNDPAQPSFRPYTWFLALPSMKQDNF